MGLEQPYSCHERERERNRVLFTVPSSSFPDLDGLTADAQTSHRYHYDAGVGVWEELRPPGDAAKGGPSHDPDVEVVCAHQGQLAPCAADGNLIWCMVIQLEQQMAGAPPPATTVPTQPGDADMRNI